MKIFYLLILLQIPNLCIAQSELQTLEERKEEITKTMSVLKKELTEIERKITLLRSQEILNKTKEQPLLAIARKGAYLKEEPDVNGKVLLKLDEDTPVQILDMKGEYFQACVKGTCGYMSQLWMNESEELENFKRAIISGALEKRRANNRIKQEQIEQERIALEKKMIQKYGKSAVDKMNNGLYWTGMNKEMIRYTLGEPDDINTSIGSWGTHEQWVYNRGMYVYFEDGIVTSMQD